MEDPSEAGEDISVRRWPPDLRRHTTFSFSPPPPTRSLFASHIHFDYSAIPSVPPSPIAKRRRAYVTFFKLVNHLNFPPTNVWLHNNRAPGPGCLKWACFFPRMMNSSGCNLDRARRCWIKRGRAAGAQLDQRRATDQHVQRSWEVFFLTGEILSLERRPWNLITLRLHFNIPSVCVVHTPIFMHIHHRCVGSI